MKKRFFKAAIKLDEILKKSSPHPKDLIQINRIIPDSLLNNYFWRNLKQVEWLPILKESGFFEILSRTSRNNNELYQTQTFVSDYILFTSEKFPDIVVELIRNTETDNDRVIWNFIKIGLNLSPSNTALLIPAVKKWISNLNMSSTLFDSEIIQWIKHLSDGKQFNAAFELLKILTTPKVQKPLIVRDKEVEKVIGKERPKAIPVIEYYYLKELLLEGLTQLNEYEPFKLSKILQTSLERAIKIEFGHNKGGLDLSYVWRAAIEDHPQNYEYYDLKDALLVALRKSTEELVKRNKISGLKIIKECLRHNYSIFRRLAIHLLRLNYDSYSDFTNKLLDKKGLLKEKDISHEYYILLRDIFQKLDPSNRKYIIESICEIKNFDKKAKPEIREKQIRYHHWEKLHFFEKHLVGDDKIYYDQLKKEFQDEKLRDTTVWHESYAGEKSPLTIDEIEKKEISELWDFFRTFRKTGKSFDTPTPEGLARIFGAAVKQNPHKYLKVDLTPLTILKPNYSYSLINNVTELFKSEKYPELVQYVENLLDIINRIVRIENIPKRFIDDMGINFTGVKKRSLDFVQSLIKTQRKEHSPKYKDEIWEIVHYLCYYEWDPEKSIEGPKTTLDPYTLAINSVRGTAFISVIDYALWHASVSKESLSTDIKYPNRLIGEERVQLLLDDKLNNKQEDASLAIHSVFGVYFANLAYLNYGWVKENIDKIFPKEIDKENYWMTAWGGFINASRFYTDLFELLKPQFERALEYLSENKKMIPSGFGRTPEDALSEHLIVACLNGKDNIYKSNSLLKRFAEIPNNPSATHAVQFIANLAKDEMIFKEISATNRKSFWPQAKEYWKIRLSVVKKELKKKKRKKEEDEFDREFSRYISWLDDLPDTITLKVLEPLLIDTISIYLKGWDLPNFIEYLSRQSGKYPLIAVRLFKQLMDTDAPNYFYHRKEKEIEQILSNAIKTKTDVAYYYADLITNKFGEWGNYYFKDFWMEHLKDKEIRIAVKLEKI